MTRLDAFPFEERNHVQEIATELMTSKDDSPIHEKIEGSVSDLVIKLIPMIVDP